MRGDTAYFAAFSGVETATRIHPHRAPGGQYRSLHQALASLPA
ncbi:MAG TPA: hypothetical protein PLA97_20605 [Rubrivivax sp.]|nr:hypothetical protein [Rubrivivax sp.]